MDTRQVVHLVVLHCPPLSSRVAAHIYAVYPQDSDKQCPCETTREKYCGAWEIQSFFGKITCGVWGIRPTTLVQCMANFTLRNGTNSWLLRSFENIVTTYIFLNFYGYY